MPREKELIKKLGPMKLKLLGALNRITSNAGIRKEGRQRAGRCNYETGKDLLKIHRLANESGFQLYGNVGQVDNIFLRPSAPDFFSKMGSAPSKCDNAWIMI